MKILSATLVALLSLTACSHKPSVEPEKIKVTDLALEPPPVYEKNIGAADMRPNSNNPIDTTKKIIKNGEINFETDNPTQTRRKILASLKSLGGYVAEENETNDADNNKREFVLMLRLPSRNFEALLDAVSTDADKIDSKIITVKDVTTQFIDIKTQLSNSRALESTYLALLKKANKMSDVLQIESKLTEIRTTIDSTQGQLNYMSKQVAFSALSVKFYTKSTARDSSPGIVQRFKNALADGWVNVETLFFAVVALWPFILLAIASWGTISYWRRKRTATKN